MRALFHSSPAFPVSFPNTNRAISFRPASTRRSCPRGSGSQEVVEHLWKEQGGKQMQEKSNFQCIWEEWLCGLAEKSCKDLRSFTCRMGTSAYTVSLLPCDGAKLPLLLCWSCQIQLFCALTQEASLAVPALLGSPVPGPPTVLVLHLVASQPRTFCTWQEIKSKEQGFYISYYHFLPPSFHVSHYIPAYKQTALSVKKVE